MPGLGVFAGTVRRLPPGSSTRRCSGTGSTAAPVRRRGCWPGSDECPVGVLRPLLRPAGGSRDGRHLRLRRPGGRRRRAGQRLGHPVPPREVGRRRPGPAGQLRGPLRGDGAATGRRPWSARRPADGAAAGHRPARRRRRPPGAGRLRPPVGLRRPPGPGPSLRERRGPLAPRGRPRRRPHRRTGQRPLVVAVAAEAAAAGVRVQTGGGVRTRTTSTSCWPPGVDRVVLGTAALEDPALAVGLRPSPPRAGGGGPRLPPPARRRARAGGPGLARRHVAGPWPSCWPSWPGRRWARWW